MKKRILSFVLVCCMMLTLVPTAAFAVESKSAKSAIDIWDGSIANGFASGNGTKDDPYIIETAAQLAFLSTIEMGQSGQYYGKYYRLVNDIYLNDVPGWENWDQQAPSNVWSPIGSFKGHFNGFFDGEGHVISGVYINSSEDYQGLFAGICHGGIKNLGIVDSYIKGNDYVGGLAGQKRSHSSFDKIEIENCYFAGNVFGNSNVGGIVGYNYEIDSAMIENCQNFGSINGVSNVGGIAGYNLGFSTGRIECCYNNGPVTGTSFVGGIVGYNTCSYAASSYIRYCYNAGTVKGNASVGGIAGSNQSTSITLATVWVENCYNIGTVNGNYYTGGIIGYNRSAKGSSSSCGAYLKNSYNVGTVHGKYYNAGGVVGYNSDGTAFINNCYYLRGCAVDGYDVEQGGVGCNSSGSVAEDKNGVTTKLLDEEMQKQESFAGFDFDTVWGMPSEGTYQYPMLRNNGFKSETDSDGEFNSILYRASFLQRESEPVVQSINHSIREATPCKEMIVPLQESGFQDAIAAWKAFDLISSSVDDITALYDFAAEPKDLYSAVILNALEASVSYDVIGSEYEDGIKDCKEFVSEVKSLMEAEFGIDIRDDRDFKNMTDEQKKELAEYTEKWFKNTQPDLCSLDKVFSNLSKALNVVGKIEDFFERIVSCAIVANTNESMKEVLRQAYQDSKLSGNINLQLALLDCIEIIDSSADEILLKIISDEFCVIGTDAAEYLIKKLLWEQVTKNLYALHPAAAIFQAAYKTGKFVSNLLFSTDDTYEQYLKMLAITDIELLIDGTHNKLKTKYLTQQDVMSASAYLSALNLVFTLRDNDCTRAYGFVDVLDQTLVNEIAKLFGKDTYSELKDYLRIRQVNYATIHEAALTAWINWLDLDYPDSGLYEHYSYLFDQSEQRMATREFVAACPVNVYVYNEANQMVASVVDGRISCNDDIMLALLGDTKIVRLYDGQNYRIEYVGTDSGEMDVTISEFGKSGECIRTVNYYNVDLEDGSSYEINIDEQISESAPYELRDTLTDTIVDYDYDSLLADDAMHTVTVHSGSLLRNGEVFLSTEAAPNETLELNAYVPDGYRFIRWESSNGMEIFANADLQSTTFTMPDENTVVKALIEPIYIPVEPSVRIKSHPQDISVVEGSTGNSLTVEAETTSEEELLYQWYTCDDGDGSNPQALDGETHNIFYLPSYTLPADLDSNTYYYFCEVSTATIDAVETNVASVTVTKVGGEDTHIHNWATEWSSDSTQHWHVCLTQEDPCGERKDVGEHVYDNDSDDTCNICGYLRTVVPPILNYTITFDANGGTVTPANVVTNTDGRLPVLPAPARNGYIFNGWYTSANAGTKITTNTVFEADTTVYAQWSIQNIPGSGSSGGSGASGYSITIPKIDNGSFSVSPKSAKKGDTVTITVKPDVGYELDSLTVTDKNSDSVKLTKKSDTQYTFVMPASKVNMEASFVKIIDSSESLPFTDVAASAYYYDAVKWAAAEGITGGTTATTFSPNAPCTRAQIVTFLWRAAGSPAPHGNVTGFEDVAENAYYADAVLWAAEQGITGGIGNGKFSPDATCTRSQSVTFLYRAAGSPAVSSSAAFCDVTADNYYANAVAWAAQNGVTGGIGEGLFGPANDCTRAQIVTFLYRWLVK